MWQAIETGDVEFAKDRLAMEAILRSMPQEMLPILASNNTAKEACDISRTLRIGVDHLHESKVQTVRLWYKEIKF